MLAATLAETEGAATKTQFPKQIIDDERTEVNRARYRHPFRGRGQVHAHKYRQSQVSNLIHLEMRDCRLRASDAVLPRGK